MSEFGARKRGAPRVDAPNLPSSDSLEAAAPGAAGLWIVVEQTVHAGSSLRSLTVTYPVEYPGRLILTTPISARYSVCSILAVGILAYPGVWTESNAPVEAPCRSNLRATDNRLTCT